MGLRLAAGVALVAVSLLGFTLATPQDASLTVGVDLKDVFDARGVNKAGLKDVDLEDDDLGKLLDRIDGLNLDPDLVDNLDPAALAGLLDGMTAEELAALGLSAAEAQDYIDRLRDPDLTAQELADIAADLSDRGLRFANDDADGRFDAGEAAYADLDGDGQVSEGDLKLGVLALLLGVDRGLSDANRDRFLAYELAGGLGLTRPSSAASRATATAATGSLLTDGYPSDRAMGPESVVCVQLYSPSLTCHTRTFVHGVIEDRGDSYLFRLDNPVGWRDVDANATASGLRARAHVIIDAGPKGFVPIPGLTPADVLVSKDVTYPLSRDANDMLWMSVPSRSGPLHVNLTWAVDLAYYDLPVAADVTSDDVPESDRPLLDVEARAIGLRIADLAGAQDRPYGDAVRAVASYVRDFGLGALPDRDEQGDDLLAIAETQVGCSRHRSEVFTLAVQALGIPARLVLNEAHAFAEVLVPKAGWHLVDLGACSRVQVRASPGHDEIMALQDLPYAKGDEPDSQADADAAAAQAIIDIVDWPPSLRPNQDFEIGGTATSADGAVPDGIPITFTYNRTKEQPGTPFCSTQTIDSGFAAKCRLPAGMPPAPSTGWQLVARMAPSVIDGAPSAPAYSDPPFVVVKATTLEVVGHAKTSADVPVAYTAHVVDEDGAPVPQRPVTLTVDGDAPITRATDASGRARFTLQLDAGPHTLAANLAGDDAYDPSEDTLRIEATATRIALQVDAARLDKGTLVVTGGIADGATPAGSRSLTARWRNDPDGAEQSKSVVSGKDGRFTITFDGLPRPGPGLASIVDGKSGVGVDVAFARSVDATATLDVPARWSLGNPAPVGVHITGPADPVPLRLTLDGLVVADLEAGDQLPASALITVPAGVHTVAVEAGAGVRLKAAPAQILVAPVEATLGPVPVQSPGSTLAVSGTLRFDGQGLPGAVQLRLLGATGNATSASDGTFTVTLAVPLDANPGNATAVLVLPELGHQVEVPLRIQRPARLTLESPGVSFQAFGLTHIVAKGEGNVTVYANGEQLGVLPVNGGAIDFPTSTLLWRKVTLRAESIPASPDVSPTTVTATIHVFNPATLAGVPLGAIILAFFGFRAARWIARRRAHRNRFLPVPARSKIRIVEPHLPRRVPRVFDPDVDGTVVLRLPRSAPWTLLDARDRPVPADVDGRAVRIALPTLGVGRHDLRFHDGKRSLPFTLTIQDLRSALDEATLGLLERIGKTSPWPATLQAMEEGLRSAGADDQDAVAVRREAEDSLYTIDRFGRDRFHAFFAALDQAQARRPT
ncbi:MAG: transglutaminase domain-containing protein [Candidatus Thermoplasmatota archaeon]